MFRNPTLTREIVDDHRKPLARYGAMGSALRKRLHCSYTTRRETIDRDCRLSSAFLRQERRMHLKQHGDRT
jgi:hypothetical protein